MNVGSRLTLAEPASFGRVAQANVKTDSKLSETFEAVFERESEAMIAMAFLVLRSQALAEEAVQDAFAKLADEFDKVHNPGGFVRTATLNRCRDLARRQNVERRLLRKFWPARAEQTYTSGDLDDVIAQLSIRRREIVVLKFFMGHSTREIAELLDIAEGTVKSNLHRALAELREVLS